MKPIIEINNISKKYRISHQGVSFSLREKLSGIITNPLEVFKDMFLSSSREDFWALKDVSFDVKKGEVVGIIGRNGAGKTTLLKVLSRITYPTEGEICLRGSIGSLLELGTGFNLELSGRENIYFNGAILGMKKKEIDRKFDQIVDFSGLEKFLDTPVKRYSSGMKIRLAFSVATFLEPDILLIDEVLAVGDAEFQKKCLGKMEDISKTGRTIIFVSHDMAAVRNLCERVILLDKGGKVMDSEGDKVISYYLGRNLQEGSKVAKEDLEGKIEGVKKNSSISFQEISLTDKKGSLRNIFCSDEEILIAVSYECHQPVNGLRMTVQIVNEENRPILIAQNTDDIEEFKLYKREPGLYKTSVVIPANMFGDNKFYISVHLENPTVDYHVVNKILGFNVEFQGYNNMYYAKFAKAFFRPCLLWKTANYKDRQEES
ncbi:MAG: ABC transporter ATP-binding protein [Candidatus Zapsychrus exili]|nr:ABC transporter ATP-binding protein [Candidatus Zapsychrus exili]